jgi:ferritin-like metal-binding protein YciE
MAKMNSLEPVLVDELRDLMDAEKQLTKALPKMARGAESDELRTAFEDHLEETRNHVERLTEALRAIGANGRGKKCKGMEGLIEEGSEHLEEDAEPSVRDAMLIGAAQKVEHYEIAAYGTARTHATQLGYEDVARLLEATLEEEKAADVKLSSIAENAVNMEAADEDEEEEEEDDRMQPRNAGRSGSRPAAAMRGNGSRGRKRSSGRKK